MNINSKMAKKNKKVEKSESESGSGEEGSGSEDYVVEKIVDRRVKNGKVSFADFFFFTVSHNLNQYTCFFFAHHKIPLLDGQLNAIACFLIDLNRLSII